MKRRKEGLTWRGFAIAGAAVLLVAAVARWGDRAVSGAAQNTAPSPARRKEPQRVRRGAEQPAPRGTTAPFPAQRRTAGGAPENPEIPETPNYPEIPEIPEKPEPPEIPVSTEPPKPKAFKTGAEQLLAMVIPAAPGAPVPPLPVLTEAGLSNDLARALEAEIVIGTNDTEETALLKEGVAALKQQYRELRSAEGWNFTEYLDAMRAQGEEDAAILRAAREELGELWKDAGVTDEEYLRRADEINAILKERGLPELEKDLSPAP